MSRLMGQLGFKWCAARCAALVAATVLAAPVHAAPMLSAGDTKADHAFLVTSATDPEKSPANAMLARLEGIERVDGANLERLRKAFRTPSTDDGTFDAAVPLCRILAVSADGRKKTWYDARVSTHAAVFLKAESGGTAMVLDAQRDPVGAVAMACIVADATKSGDGLKAGDTVVVPPAPATLRINQDLLKSRLFAGTSLVAAPVERELASGRVAIRLPKGSTPQSHSGVLLWINGDDEARIPENLCDAADDLNLILVSQVDAGNGTPVSSRLQRVCDSLATVCEKVLIDRSRIYVGGISGGGKSSVLLATAFPELFAGAFPVVGFGCYEKTQSPQVIGEWPPLFTRPRGQHWTLFSALRFAVVTGDKDFNHAPILASVHIFERDKLTVQLFDVPGMAHQVPPAENASQALVWLDEPRHTAQDAREKRADALLASTDKPRQEILSQVLELAPYSAQAWKAAQELHPRAESK